MTKIYVSTDDMRPSMIPLWERTWDVLKQKHPGLKVTAFVPAYYQEFGFDPIEDIGVSDDFRLWFEKRKDWVCIVPHGLHHTKPFENEFDLAGQKMVIKLTLNVLKPYVDESCLGWKAPFYKADIDTYRALIDSGIVFLEQWWTLIPLKPIRRPLQPVITVGSHTGTELQNCPDNIDRLMPQLDAFLSSQPVEFLTAVEIMKTALEER